MREQWTHVRLLFTRRKKKKKKKKAENVDAAKRQETRKPNTHNDKGVSDFFLIRNIFYFSYLDES